MLSPGFMELQGCPLRLATPLSYQYWTELAKPVKKKQPFTTEMLGALVKDANEHCSLPNIRITAATLLAYAGFFHFDELSDLHPVDLKFDKDMVTVQIRKSKNDQLRKWDKVAVARAKNTTCPVGMLERYMSMGNIDPQDARPLFCGITHSNFGEKLRVAGGLSYTRMWELLQMKLQQLGHSPDLFGTHSLRSSGATAVANAGVPDRLFKRHGRWCSEGAKDGYVEDSLDSRLSVSGSWGCELCAGSHA